MVDTSAITVRDAVKESPSLVEGGDLAKFVRGLNAELRIEAIKVC